MQAYTSSVHSANPIPVHPWKVGHFLSRWAQAVEGAVGAQQKWKVWHWDEAWPQPVPAAASHCLLLTVQLNLSCNSPSIATP